MVVLHATKRDPGKAHKLRSRGLLPAVVYGRKEESVPIAVPLREFQKVLDEAGESSIVELMGLGDQKDVLIHDVEFDAVTGVPLHVDLYAIEQGQTVEVAIPLEFDGVSGAVKDLGGILVKVVHELVVEAQPKNLPHSLVVPIDRLATLEDQIHVRDIVLPPGVVAKADPNDVVAMISVAKDEPVEETPMDISQIEQSIERGKKEEEEAPQEGGAA